jgi:hypothetical protein
VTARKSSINKWWKTDGVLGEHFRTKAELENRIRGIVAKYPLETHMGADDAAFLTAIFQRHYGWDIKRGCGVQTYFTRTVTAWTGPTTGIWIKRTDGSEVDISWVVALMPGGAPSGVLLVSTAARYEVVDQRNAASNAVAWGAPCPICGEPLFDGRHVDHRPPKTFKALLESWLESVGLTHEEVKTEEVGVADAQFVDRELGLQWAEYHRANAELRVIHKHEKLARVL